MATSRAMTAPGLATAAARKGIDVLASGDFTHPAWLSELQRDLKEVSEGVFRSHAGAKFILGTELSCVWKQDGRGRRVHILVLAPGFEAVASINARLAAIANLESDGRPVLRLSGRELAALVWEADERCVVIPAHVWTPWYGVYGSKSGFDSLAECFGDLASRVRAVETGLSSDPSMNWRVPDVDGRTIMSFSDAHSPATLGRELSILDAEPTYDGITGAISGGRVVETIEFYPENGKYHLNGHRKCGVRLEPSETPADGKCPNCSRPLTLGVLHRIEELAGRPEQVPMGEGGLIEGPPGRPPFRRLSPLRDLVAQALGFGPATKSVSRACNSAIDEFGSELAVLLEATADDLARASGGDIAHAVIAARRGEVEIDPGYDGVYGTVRVRSAG